MEDHGEVQGCAGGGRGAGEQKSRATQEMDVELCGGKADLINKVRIQDKLLLSLSFENF